MVSNKIVTEKKQDKSIPTMLSANSKSRQQSLAAHPLAAEQYFSRGDRVAQEIEDEVLGINQPHALQKLGESAETAQGQTTTDEKPAQAANIGTAPASGGGEKKKKSKKGGGGDAGGGGETVTGEASSQQSDVKAAKPDAADAVKVCMSVSVCEREYVFNLEISSVCTCSLLLLSRCECLCPCVCPCVRVSSSVCT